jgi:hypothetical protein
MVRVIKCVVASLIEVCCLSRVVAGFEERLVTHVVGELCTSHLNSTAMGHCQYLHVIRSATQTIQCVSK